MNNILDVIVTGVLMLSFSAVCIIVPNIGKFIDSRKFCAKNDNGTIPGYSSLDKHGQRLYRIMIACIVVTVLCLLIEISLK